MEPLYKKHVNQYTNAIQESLNAVKSVAPPICELNYFFEVTERYFSLSWPVSGNPNVIVWGTNIPEELILSFGISPCRIAGGSFAVSAQADAALPRDTDPVSRSSYGMLQNKLTEKSLVLIPAVNDSSKKIAYMLKAKGVKVHVIDIPQPKNALPAKDLTHQMELCAQAIAKHVGRPFSYRKFNKAAHIVFQAKTALRDFISVSMSRATQIPDILRMFILYSYYCTDDIAQWAAHLQKLNGKLKETPQTGQTGKSAVLLVGSPVYFPNYKVPLLLREAGLTILANLDYSAIQSLSPVRPVKSISSMVSRYYQSDCSGAYAKNERLCQHIEEAIKRCKPDGVVFHILKGQIEYDYELNRMENIFYEKNIPVFRLETDYNKQDVEQLRIRTEAFSEVLVQRKFAEVSGL